MQAKGLIDTGAILAILNPKDRWHDRCVEAFEFFHLLGDHPQNIADGWRFLRSGAVTVLPIGDGDMPDLDRLMKQYGNRPMAFADATLVRLAKREALSTICTIDHDDFETYRIDGTRRFRILPVRY